MLLLAGLEGYIREHNPGKGPESRREDLLHLHNTYLTFFSTYFHVFFKRMKLPVILSEKMVSYFSKYIIFSYNF